MMAQAKADLAAGKSDKPVEEKGPDFSMEKKEEKDQK